MEYNKDLNTKEGKYDFPAELLNGSNEERKRYFRDYIVSHKFLEEAINCTISFITAQVSERIVFVCGPSGVGKKELINGIKARLIEIKKPTLIENPGCIPVVSIEAIAPEVGSFNFRNLWMSALEAINEPMLDNKISYRKEECSDSLGRTNYKSKIQKADALEVLQKALRYREVGALIINEAHHMLRVASGKKVNWSVDLLKSLVNLSQTPIILVGTYELATFLADIDTRITDQINQRTKIVHFRRYGTIDKNEVMIFGKTAKMLLLRMPLEQTAEKLIDEDWKYFYAYTLGCIGTLKIWLMDAFSLAIEEQAKTLTKEHLEKARKTGYICSKLLESAMHGEKTMLSILTDVVTNEDNEFKDFRQQLFSSPKGVNQVNSNKGNTKVKSLSFERSPKRDIVGFDK